MKEYHYYGSCVEQSGDDINAMRRNSPVEVSYRTFLKYCDIASWAKDAGYGRDTGLHLSRDWHVGFYKSTFKGKSCYYLVHSAIEHIWIKQ